MDVCGYRQTEFLADFAEDAATFDDARATEGVYRGAVCLIIRGLKNELDASALSNLFDRACHLPGKFFGFKCAWAEDEKRGGRIEGKIADLTHDKLKRSIQVKHVQGKWHVKTVSTLLF